MKPIVKAALAVANKYPVFPTHEKMPAWSNRELGVARGEGGYKVASSDPDRVIELFSHDRATEIAVPMGAMSGLICVDVDLWKDPALQTWIDEWPVLSETLTHETRNGGRHYIFQHPGDNIRFPSTLRAGVDLKAGGTGYICVPPTEGYKVIKRRKPRPFPLELLRDAMKAKGGTGNLTGEYNSETDDALIEKILTAEELYPALRTLSMRLAMRTNPDGTTLSEVEQINTLSNLMDASEASAPSHPRYDDWLDRRARLEPLVESAIHKAGAPLLSDAQIDAIASIQGDTFIKTQQIIAAASRPIGPQQLPTSVDIEMLLRAREDTSNNSETDSESDAPETGNEEQHSAFTTINIADLSQTKVEPIDWIIPQVLPAQSTVSIAGASNVGKTRYMCALLVALAVGDTKRVGLPQCKAPVTSMYICNEERAQDIRRRIRAEILQHGDTSAVGSIIVRGKENGTLQLVTINETGNAEINKDVVADIVAEQRRTGAQVLVFDPFGTLSGAMDENSAASAGVLNSAFILLTSLTGATCIYAHHTPKDRAADADVFRGTSSAWRGSSAIYAALDCGFTLSNWLPADKDLRKLWKQGRLDQKLDRWIVLDCGKIREGETISPAVFELIGQEMTPGEGDPIGVCRLATPAEALNALSSSGINAIGGKMLADDLFITMGAGLHAVSKVHKNMHGNPVWPIAAEAWHATKHMPIIEEALPVVGDKCRVTLESAEGKKHNVRWLLKVEASEAE
jgi:RecA-family ATPase